MATRVYLLVARGELNVKGFVYSRSSTPILYWIMTVIAVLGTALTLGIASILAWAFSQGWGPDM